MSNFKVFKRTNNAEMRSFIEGEKLVKSISINEEDKKAGSPKVGDMIARNPENHKDQWLVASKYFTENFAELEEISTEKTLHNSNASGASKNVKDIIFWGNGDTFKLISKASSKKEGWMKSTKACFVGAGCIVQVTTQQGEHVAEAVCFVPGTRIVEHTEDGVVTSRSLSSAIKAI